VKKSSLVVETSLAGRRRELITQDIHVTEVCVGKTVATTECRREKFVGCRKVHRQTLKESSYRGVSKSAEDICVIEVSG